MGSPAHRWSGLGLPFFLMLLDVVSLKCSRPSVTLVVLPLGKLTLVEYVYIFNFRFC